MQLIAEWTITILILIISIVFFVMTFSFPKLIADPGGLSFFPRVLSIITGVGAMIQLMRLLTLSNSLSELRVSITKYKVAWKEETDREASDLTRLTTYVFLLSIGYPFFVIRAGFILATIVYTLTLMLIMRAKIHLSLIYSCFLGISLYLVFGRILRVAVPAGSWIEKIFG